MSRASIESAFPRLKRIPYSLTSPATETYNCIAWAAGETHRVWWPLPPSPYTFWPAGAPRKVELAAFVAAFATLGYTPCPDGVLETGYEKVAIFVNPQGEPTHAARQLPNGTWTSKLGRWEDISHSIYGLEHGFYGDVVQYLRRAVNAPGPSASVVP